MATARIRIVLTIGITNQFNATTAARANNAVAAIFVVINRMASVPHKVTAEVPMGEAPEKL